MQPRHFIKRGCGKSTNSSNVSYIRQIVPNEKRSFSKHKKHFKLYVYYKRNDFLLT